MSNSREEEKLPPECADGVLDIKAYDAAINNPDRKAYWNPEGKKRCTWCLNVVEQLADERYCETCRRMYIFKLKSEFKDTSEA